MTRDEAEQALKYLESKALAAIHLRAWAPVRCCTPDYQCRLVASIHYGYDDFQYFHHGCNIDREAAITVLMLEDGV